MYSLTHSHKYTLSLHSISIPSDMLACDPKLPRWSGQTHAVLLAVLITSIFWAAVVTVYPFLDSRECERTMQWVVGPHGELAKAILYLDRGRLPQVMDFLEGVKYRATHYTESTPP